MTNAKLNFTRYEKKYMLSPEQFDAVKTGISSHMEPDPYSHSTVCSLYYDDENSSVIRRSLEKPVFKEKLRLRSYGVPEPDQLIFVELKKKFDGVVYKQRLPLIESEAMLWLSGQGRPKLTGRLVSEIDWLVSRQQLVPSAYISCDREAFFSADFPGLRLTFDKSIRFRRSDLRLSSGCFGDELLEKGQTLMEMKLESSAPLWLARLLSESRAFPLSFSKYGEGYRREQLQKYNDGVN